MTHVVNVVLTPRKQDEVSEFAKFARRIIRAYGRRVAEGDIEALADLIALSDELHQVTRQTVAGLRGCGYSWGEIAARLNVSRQAVQQRWRMSDKATGLRGLPLAEATLRFIETHQSQWLQSDWQVIYGSGKPFDDQGLPNPNELEKAEDAACGTVGCFAGHAALIAGAKNVVRYDGTFNPLVSRESRVDYARAMGWGEIVDSPQPWAGTVQTPRGVIKSVSAWAAEALDLSTEKAHELFYATHSLTTLREMVTNWRRGGTTNE